MMEDLDEYFISPGKKVKISLRYKGILADGNTGCWKLFSNSS